MKLTIVVKPGAKHKEAVEETDGGYVVYVKAPAKEGKANEAACALLAKHFGVAKTKVRVVYGATSKHKIVEVEHSDIY